MSAISLFIIGSLIGFSGLLDHIVQAKATLCRPKWLGCAAACPDHCGRLTASPALEEGEA
ncbi:MAG: hypothetical protein ACYCZU_08035 [Devosia sp.]